MGLFMMDGACAHQSAWRGPDRMDSGYVAPFPARGGKGVCHADADPVVRVPATLPGLRDGWAGDCDASGPRVAEDPGGGNFARHSRTVTPPGRGVAGDLSALQ